MTTNANADDAMTRHPLLPLLAPLLCLVLVACENDHRAEQRDEPVQGDGASAGGLNDPQVAALLRFIDGTEVGTAKQLLPKLATAPGRSYAQMLVDDHTRMREVARERTELDDSSAPPPQFRTLRAVTSTQAAMFMTLPAGRSFDATFLGVQAANHAMVLDSLREWRNRVADEGLRQTIDAAIPIVDAHRERALAAFRAVQGADATPLSPPRVRADSAGPRQEATRGAPPPDSTAPAG